MGNNNNVPIKPPGSVMEKIDKMTVDFATGTVYGVKGEPLGGCGKWRGGRCRINIRHNGKPTAVPRYYIIWYKFYGRWPVLEIDHIDEDKTNDSIANLKETNSVDNTQKAKRSRLPRFVSYDKFSDSYRVRDAGKNTDLGRFKTLETAVEASLRLW